LLPSLIQNILISLLLRKWKTGDYFIIIYGTKSSAGFVGDGIVCSGKEMLQVLEMNKNYLDYGFIN